MFCEIPDLMTPAEVAELRQLATRLRFVDGRVTNPDSQVKNNLQGDLGDPLHEQASKLLRAALSRSPRFVAFAFPKLMAPPALSLYRPGMNYGAHADAAFLPLGARPIRADLSCTIFLSDPETYVGGALRIRLGDVDHRVRGKAGSAVVYPSTTLHEVEPVESGERLVGLTFMQSRIRDTALRDLLYELNEVAALEGLKMDFANYSRLQRVQFNLLRLWSEAG